VKVWYGSWHISGEEECDLSTKWEKAVQGEMPWCRAGNDFWYNSLLRCESHTMQFTHVMCAIYWFVFLSPSYVAIISVICRIFSLLPKDTQYPYPVTPHSLHCYHYPLGTFLYLLICQACTFHIHGIIQYVTFVSLSVMSNISHVITCINTAVFHC
jgi:hypothetical protein